MNQVYSHSYCNIAACDSSDSNGGLFRDRLHLALGSIVSSKWDDCANAFYSVCYDRNLSAHARANKLRERGWCVQESLLSRRTLHFGPTRLWWTCRELSACEMFPFGIPNHEELSVRSKLGQLEGQLHSFFDRYDHVGSWQKIIEAYSRCDLTEEKDKLVALSGLANEIMAATGDVYLAGLWKSELLRQLVWASVRDIHTHRSSHFRAPSWSWASLEGEVQFGNVSDEAPLAQVSEVHGKTVEDNPTGEVCSCLLVVEADVFKVDALLSSLGGFEYFSDHHGPEKPWTLWLDVAPTAEGERAWSSWVFVPLFEWVGLVLLPGSGEEPWYTRVGIYFASEWKDQSFDSTDFTQWWSSHRKPELAGTPLSQRQLIHII